MKTNRSSLIACTLTMLGLTLPLTAQSERALTPVKKPTEHVERARPVEAPKVQKRRVESRRVELKPSQSYRLGQPRPLEARAKLLSPQESLRHFEKQLADLNAATERRRAELMKQLAESRARLAVEERRKKEEKAQPLNPFAPSILQQMVGGAQSEPEWIIGVVLEAGEGKDGLKVRDCREGNPAAKAGLKEGDVLVSCNGLKLRNREAFVHLIQAAQDQALALTIRRPAGEDGLTEVKQLVISVTPVRNEAARPKAGVNPANPGMHPDYGAAVRGFNFDRNLTPESYQQYFNHLPKQDAGELRKEVQELKQLLLQLGEEVRKLKAQ